MRVSSFSIRVSTSFAFLGMLFSDVWNVVVAWARFEFARECRCLLPVTLSQRDRLGLYRTQAVACAVGFDPTTCGFGDRCSTC